MRTLAALAFVFSAQAFACPNLTGTYTCTYQNGSKEAVSVSQDQKGTVTIYNINGSEMPADGQTYQVPEDDSLKEGTFKSWCDDDVTLKGLLLGKYYSNGDYYGDLTMNIEWSLDNGNLKQSSKGEIKNTGGSYPLSNDTVCTKN